MRSLADVDVLSPASVDEALEILHQKAGGIKIVAGGTDLIVQMKHRIIGKTDLLNIYMLDELRYIRLENGSVRVGGLTDFATIHKSPVVRTAAPVLAEAASTIGSVQILNKASIAGNIVNASPAADSLPALYVLEADLHLRSKASSRTVPIRDFYKGYKKLDMRPDELLVEVSFKQVGDGYLGKFFKHGLRQGDAIAVVNGAVLLKWDASSKAVSEARIALGAVAPTVVRAEKAEAILVGSRLEETAIVNASRAVQESISPIDDVRGSAAYRREMSTNYVYMTLRMLAEMVRK
ncbi:MAG: xanthine dehydrogenase family protein subunit M [Candidatus Caldarchaeum sp.]|nr:xanthine dehydrogenase family protein subunit M [Candidatus Caldarchaeum sp.]MDW8360080.1 xanthine dehydrogenase family protein subunit M [Candidatus Caldarchaeum sp.]